MSLAPVKDTVTFLNVECKILMNKNNKSRVGNFGVVGPEWNLPVETLKKVNIN